MRDTVLSYIRTFVPVWVASLVALAAKAGIDLPLNQTTIVVLAAAISGYYLIGRLLEKVPPLAWLGKLLLSAGLAGEPTYGDRGRSSQGGSPYAYGGYVRGDDGRLGRGDTGSGYPGS
ncbi:hypothetical protein [Streptosporangium sp. NPDC051022]|uniref:hypothetical protein n=1 Tax=Streptosporangium sp. NPDC051022 TaxID=3155752 RepID=UPI00341ADF8C